MNYDLISNVKYPIVSFSESKVLEDSTLHNYFKISKNLLEDLRSNRINVSDAFDVEKLAMDTAIMNLFGAIHGFIILGYFLETFAPQRSSVCIIIRKGRKFCFI